MLTRFGIPPEGPRAGRKGYWDGKLHGSVDGYELRESPRTPASTRWISNSSIAIPGRDFVQYVHVHSNSLPTRIRTSRGNERRRARDVKCRAGCELDETAAHVIQHCHRTHGGRVYRHNAVCNVIAADLASRGWKVEQEPHVQTGAGLRKPDMLATRDGNCLVLDAQVVGGSGALNLAHEGKKRKYADDADLVRLISERVGVPQERVTFSTVTLTWRGVWAPRSYADLISFGIPPGVLGGVTTRVLQGSHTNWSRFNRMTTYRGRQRV